MNDKIAQGLIITDPQSGKRYSLIKKLGEGGFGEVWQAYLVDDWHYQIAIKFFLPLEESDKRQFLTEYQQSANFRHEDVLPSLFYGEWNNRLFIGMNFCEYGTAAQFVGNLTPGNKEDENLIWSLIYDTANGLEYLHENQNIVHQDIKPDNIMIKSEGDFVIMDFGISINVESQLTSDNYKNFGSPAYMAPERFTDSGNLVFANDIWSFGVTIYELAEGELPFCGLGGNYLTGSVPKLSQAWSQELNMIMQSCLIYEPWLRKRASDIKQYAKWVLGGKEGAEPWKLNISNREYPHTNGALPNENNQGGGRATQRNNNSNNGRSTERNKPLKNENISNYPDSNPNYSQSNVNNNNPGINPENNKVKKNRVFKILLWIIITILISTVIYFFMMLLNTKTDLEAKIKNQSETISSYNNLINTIENVCHDGSTNLISRFDNWVSSNHKDNTQDLEEYSFYGYSGDIVRFLYDVDCENSYDKFICQLATPSGTTEKLIEVSGRNKNGFKSYTLPAEGQYTLILKYTKDHSYNKGNDCARITNIEVEKSLSNEILRIVNASAIR